MHDQIKHQPTIGFISTWPVYQATTIDRYARSLIQGISAAASEQACNLLLGCGFSATGNSPQRRSFWPAPRMVAFFNRLYYCLTLPAVNPAIYCFWRAIKTRMTGMVTNVAAAIESPWGHQFLRD